MSFSEEENLLTQTGRGTPCGDLMRRYWQPAALSEELSSDKPLPVQLFGEELILFRDGAGTPALIGRYCAHQGVDMIYGCIEPDGIRCMYHGWLFDSCGKVVIRGAWVEGGEKRMEVGQPAYPCLEAGGVIFTYMGPGEAPDLPAREWFANPALSLTLTKATYNESYLSGITRDGEAGLKDEKFVMPNLVIYQAASSNTESYLKWHVPVDDNSHEEFTARFVGAAPFAGESFNTARQALAEAIDEIRPQLQASPDAVTKNS